MARQLRNYIPGGIFHITARTRGKAAWFDEPIRDVICESIAIVQQRSDVRIIAFVVMPNHLHLVLQQRDNPLSRFMHPLLCRIAAAVKKKFSVEGHIFERRYWDHPCMSPDYLHRCIEYVHDNPVKAELCDSPEQYRWSSFSTYKCGAQRSLSVAVEPLFEFAYPKSGLPSLLPWINRPGRPQRDLGDLVDHVLRQFEPAIDIGLLRNMRGRTAAQVRRSCIRQAAISGYRNCQIARYLKISESVVSKVVVVLRRNDLMRSVCLDAPKSESDKQVRKK